jgi:hypothetical protein
MLRSSVANEVSPAMWVFLVQAFLLAILRSGCIRKTNIADRSLGKLMFDYKLLSALAAVVEQAGFERAAQVWACRSRRSPSASNCLKRGSANRCWSGHAADATEIGRRLLNHVQQVRLLERDLQTLVPALDEEGLPERLRIA